MTAEAEWFRCCVIAFHSESTIRRWGGLCSSTQGKVPQTWKRGEEEIEIHNPSSRGGGSLLLRCGPVSARPVKLSKPEDNKVEWQFELGWSILEDSWTGYFLICTFKITGLISKRVLHSKMWVINCDQACACICFLFRCKVVDIGYPNNCFNNDLLSNMPFSWKTIIYFYNV